MSMSSPRGVADIPDLHPAAPQGGATGQKVTFDEPDPGRVARVDVVVRRPVESDLSGWRGLWDQYLVFYQAHVAPGDTETLWNRILAAGHPIECLVADHDGDLVGLVHYFPHPDTWDARPVCYLQDLFVHPGSRGRGVGAALIEAVRREAGEEGWSAVYWQTAEDNVRARRLYDRLTGGPSGFIVYQVDVVDGA
jgi:GNAT superfamily N-acetyltransferase